MTAHLSGRGHRKSLFAAAACVCTIIYLLYGLPSGLSSGTSSALHNFDAPAESYRSSCRDLPGANDTVVVMKTGSTEIQDKLPIHIATTLRCYPHYVILSDASEQFQSEAIIDVLEDVDPQYKETHDDFELYRRLRENGRNSLEPSELSDHLNPPLEGTNGNPANPGWKLDKWKFLPMMRKTLELHPVQKWYVFVETDTLIFWKTALSYMAALDWTKPYYLGAQVFIGDVEFAHGGSGFLVSRPALELVVEHYVEHKHELEEFTQNHWAGDCVLGKAFKDAGISLTHAWPILQGDPIGDMNYGHSQNLWCQPSVSYHHLTPSVIEDVWNFEQTWLQGAGQAETGFLRHKDVFAEYVLPQAVRSRNDWDNHCKDDRGPVLSLDECRAICDVDTDCLQYALSPDGRCSTTSRPNLGEAATGFQAGWFHNRMQSFYAREEVCADEGWLS